MTLEEKKVEVSKIKCPKCGKLNPVDVSRCIYCQKKLNQAGSKGDYGSGG